MGGSGTLGSGASRQAKAMSYQAGSRTGSKVVVRKNLRPHGFSGLNGKMSQLFDCQLVVLISFQTVWDSSYYLTTTPPKRPLQPPQGSFQVVRWILLPSYYHLTTRGGSKVVSKKGQKSQTLKSPQGKKAL